MNQNLPARKSIGMIRESMTALTAGFASFAAMPGAIAAEVQRLREVALK
jgi:hypothetical protein